MDNFEEEFMKVSKKATRSLRRLCRLMKERAGRERQMKAFESFARVFGKLKAFALGYLIRGKLSASKVMAVRNDIRHAMSSYLRMRDQFSEMYEGHDDKGIAKIDKMVQRSYNRADMEVILKLSSQDPDELDECEPCESQ